MAVSTIDPNGLNIGQIGGTRNKIINGAMVIDQRNAGAAFTSLTTGVTYTLDRWCAVLTGVVNTFSVQRNAGSVTPPAGFSSYLGVVSLAATTPAAGDFYQIKQHVEGFNVADLAYGTAAAQPITVSFWVRSSLTGNFGLVISWGSSSSNQRSYPALYAISAANTWEYKTVTIPGDTTAAAGGFETGNGSGIQLRFSLGGGATNAGTSGAWAAANVQTVTGDTSVVGTNGATFYLTGIQLEAGDTATPFEHRSYGQELTLCQRYYQKFNAPCLRGVAGGTNNLNRVGMNLPVTMRSAPTVASSGTHDWYDGNTAGTATTAFAAYSTPNSMEFDFSTATGGTTIHYPIIFYIGGSGGIVTASAEL